MSLISLSSYFESDGWQIFFMMKSYPAAVKLIKKYNLNNVVLLDKEISIPSEVIKINEVIAEQNIDLVFFEITETLLSEYTGITPDVSKACVSFDGHILDDMDLVIDWDVEYSKYFQPEKYPKTIFLLGPEYVILPGSFDIDRIHNRDCSHPPEKLLICMGGADEYDFTHQVVKRIADLDNRMKLVIILGSGYQFRDGLEQYLETTGCRFEIKENISTIFEEYMQCDLAVGAGGLVSSELIATGTPALLIATYEHQEARCRYFDKKGWAIYLGSRDDWKITELDILDAKICDTPELFFRTKEIIRICNAFRKQ